MKQKIIDLENKEFEATVCLKNRLYDEMEQVYVAKHPNGIEYVVKYVQIGSDDPNPCWFCLHEF